MERIELLPGEEIIICADREQANQFCRENPTEKHKVWMESETWPHCLDNPEQLQAVIDAKRAKPGRK